MNGTALTWRGHAVLPGPAASQGSKRIGRNRATGAPIPLDASPRTRGWRKRLTAEMRRCAPPEPLDEPMYLQIEIYVPRPKSHYGTGRNAGLLKPSAPSLPATGLDWDKVARCASDACEAAGWVCNDARFCYGFVMRRYAETPDAERVEVRAWPLREAGQVHRQAPLAAPSQGPEEESGRRQGGGR